MTRQQEDTPLWRWEEEEATQELVRALQSGTKAETRMFLRIVLKWMKIGLKKDGKKDQVSIEKAFALVDWMVRVSTEGDTRLNIEKQDGLQPNQALHSILTASRRTGSAFEAQRAFDLMLAYGFTPDVVAYTTLIDVLARSGDTHGALQAYNSMRDRKNPRPNVVTFSTVIHAIGFTTLVDPSRCLTLLQQASETEDEERAMDDALFLDALDVCVMRKSIGTADNVLQAFHTSLLARQLTPNNTRQHDRLLHILSKLVGLADNQEMFLKKWQGRALLTQDDVDEIMRRHHSSPRRGGAKTLGSLGARTASSKRQTIIQHALEELLARVSSRPEGIGRDKFETLLAQCRKRKWKEEVKTILETMQNLGEAEDCSHFAPTRHTFVLAVKCYLVSGEEELAWETFQTGRQTKGVDDDSNDQADDLIALYRAFVNGCVLPTNVPDLIQHARDDGVLEVVFTSKEHTSLARMHGQQHFQALDLVLPQLIPAADYEAWIHSLVLACAGHGNVDGVKTAIKKLEYSSFRRSAKTEMAVVLCCAKATMLTDGLESLHTFQREGYALAIPSYASILREISMQAAGARRQGEKTIEEMVDLRIPLFEAAIAEREALDQAMRAGNSDVRESIGEFWCRHSDLDCAPLMFLQHFVELSNSVRDKQAKSSLQNALCDAVRQTGDAWLFVLRMVLTVSTLPWLPRNARPQARLVKQLLALVGNVPYEAQHVAFVAGHLDYTVNVCVAKELNDVLGLSEHASDEFFAFCFDALEREPLDKTLSMLMSSDELYVLETVERCINVLAERYVADHTSVVSTNAILSFFQPPPEHEEEAFEAWQELRRRFLRELITLESENEMDAAVLTTTRRAISEFHLEHDAEFMPYIARPTAKPKKHTIESFLTLELPSGRVVVVDDARSLALANEVLLPTPLKGTIRRVGIDVEWKPESLGGSRSRCALLQLATDSHVFLFDLIAISMDSLAPTFQHVLSSPGIVKLGFALDGDFIRLRESFPLAKCFDRVENVQDLACIAHRRRSLKSLVKHVLGQPLDKREQCSDWEARPLTPDQITYAALDAYCLLLVQDQLP